MTLRLAGSRCAAGGRRSAEISRHRLANEMPCIIRRRYYDPDDWPPAGKYPRISGEDSSGGRRARRLIKETPDNMLNKLTRRRRREIALRKHGRRCR